MTADTNLRHAPHTDIIQRFDSPFMVVGFFTPDYASAAMAFAKNLVEHRISHHLYARPKAEGDWFSQTRQKPSVLAAARKDHPDDILVLMDVDCRVRGDINGILHSPGDVALRTKRTTVGSRYALKPCTRVMVLRPTAGSTAFVAAWQAACQSSLPGSAEAVLMLSMSDTPEKLYGRHDAVALCRDGTSRRAGRCPRRSRQYSRPDPPPLGDAQALSEIFSRGTRCSL